MTINTLLLTSPQRKKVAWLSASPPDDAKAAFGARGFQVETCSPSDLNNSGYIASVAAVVFVQNSSKLRRVQQDLIAHAVKVLDYDCRILIQTVESRSQNGRPFLIEALRRLQIPAVGLSVDEARRCRTSLDSIPGLPPLPYAQVFSNEVAWTAVANAILQDLPGPPPNSTLKIEPDRNQLSLSVSSERLLRRAFSDCSEVHLIPIDEGRSGANVYCAYAELSNVMFSKWPLPFFVKIGKRRKILKEFINYRDFVDPYLPFHLGPHLIHERCGLGARNGVIVGDWVEGSEALVHCVRDGRAGSALACLFDRTLAGWYRSAVVNHEPSGLLREKLIRAFPMNISAERLRRARQLGATKSPNDLLELFKRCNWETVLIGLCHGDLHAGNIRVRGADAIVIDFYRHDVGPLVLDAASLEASLIVDGIGCCQNALEIRYWLECVESLYGASPFTTLNTHPVPKNPSYWFHACVRQIRLHARQMEKANHQYATALALALLIKASKDAHADEPESSYRACAYLLAERLLKGAFSTGLEDYCI